MNFQRRQVKEINYLSNLYIVMFYSPCKFRCLYWQELQKRIKKTEDHPDAVDEVRQARASAITGASSFLYEAYKIMMVGKHVKERERYVHLERQSIFDSLVDLYAVFFKVHWARIRCTLDLYTADNQVSGWIQTARVYISVWFRDLYVSNRQAIGKHSSLGFSDKYTVLSNQSH